MYIEEATHLRPASGRNEKSLARRQAQGHEQATTTVAAYRMAFQNTLLELGGKAATFKIISHKKAQAKHKKILFCEFCASLWQL